MKKALIFFIALAVFFGACSAKNKNAQDANADQQEFGIRLGTYSGRGTPGRQYVTVIEFSSNNRIKMWEESERSGATDLIEKSGQYVTSNEDGLDFITISWSTGTQEKFLFLIEGEMGLYLYNSDSTPYFDGYGEFDKLFGDDSWIKASSSFQEMQGGETVLYSPDKLGIKIGECWVPNNEINERLTLTFPENYYGLYISSGFVSFAKPYLYRENSRIKKIRLSDNYGNSKIVELKDTPHFQTVEYDGFNTPWEEIPDDSGFYYNDIRHVMILNIEILEVYPGTKYTDTCVNSIFTEWAGGTGGM